MQITHIQTQKNQNSPATFNTLKKSLVLIGVSALLGVSPALSTYLKDMNKDLVSDELQREDKKGFMRHTREKVHVRRLMRHIAIEDASSLHDGFVTICPDFFKNLSSEGNFTLIDGDIPYDPQTQIIVASYFAKPQEDQSDAKKDFRDAMALMRSSSKKRDLVGLVSKVERAAEVGYIPAILAYGVMNRYGLFGLHKNVALAEAFLKVAAGGNSSIALGYLSKIRREHYVLGVNLKKTLLMGHDHMPDMQLMRAASIGGGNMAYEFADTYLGVLKGDIRRDRIKVVQEGAKATADVAASAGIVALKTGVAVGEHLVDKTIDVGTTTAVKAAVTGIKTAVAA